MLDNIEWLGHSTIKFNFSDNVIYIDPYNILKNYNDADVIFITHSHYDHFSSENIDKVRKENTKIIITPDIYNNVLDLGFNSGSIVQVNPDDNYSVDDIKFSTVHSYNVDKCFHSKINNWVGYIIDINNIKYYIAGDTDITDENKEVECDVAFLPVGGTYTMDYREAATLANIIKPKIVVPIHYGYLVGTKEDALNFKKLLDKSITCEFIQEI